MSEGAPHESPAPPLYFFSLQKGTQDMSDLRSQIIGAIHGVEERKPYEGELAYFQANPTVAGMAAEDNRIVMNPSTRLTPQELNAVRLNEAARVHMRKKPPPTFDLTPEQAQFLETTTYKAAPDADRRGTIAARLLSGDPSAGTATAQQMEYVKALRRQMGMGD